MKDKKEITIVKISFRKIVGFVGKSHRESIERMIEWKQKHIGQRKEE